MQVILSDHSVERQKLFIKPKGVAMHFVSLQAAEGTFRVGLFQRQGWGHRPAAGANIVTSGTFYLPYRSWLLWYFPNRSVRAYQYSSGWHV